MKPYDPNRNDWADWRVLALFLGVPYGVMVAVIVPAIMGRL